MTIASNWKNFRRRKKKDDSTNELLIEFKIYEDAYFSLTLQCIRGSVSLYVYANGVFVCERISFGLLVKDDNSDYNNNRR